MEQSADKAQSGPQAEAPNEANPKSGVDPDPWAVSEESKTGKPWGEDSKEIQADPQAKSWDSLEFGYDRGARVARGGYPRGDRGNFRSSDRGPSRNRGPRGRGRGNFKFHKEKNSDENAQYEPRGPHERGGRNRGSWKSGEHQE